MIFFYAPALILHSPLHTCGGAMPSSIYRVDKTFRLTTIEVYWLQTIHRKSDVPSPKSQVPSLKLPI